MYSSIQKKSLLVVILTIVTIFCLVFFINNSTSANVYNDSYGDFIQFENKIIDLLNEDKETSSESGLKARSLNSSNNSASNSTFALKRLIVLGDIDYYYGAKEVISGYKDYNILSFDSEAQTAYAYNQLSKNDNITVIIDQEIHTSDYADNDYVYGSNYSWGAKAMNVGGIYDYLQTNGTSEDIVVAVLDTGINVNHTLFSDRLLEENGKVVGYNYYQAVNKEEYDFEDDNGHGSHVAGIITQLTPSNVKILPIKVLNSNGSGTFLVFISALERVLSQYSDDYNICCVNMSLGGSASALISQQLNNLFNQLREKNILSVISAGNDQLDTSDYMPANCESAIVVSALERNNDVYSFDYDYSNFGSTIDISAPGTSILSASHTSNSGGCYKSGTSMAAPHVSAAVALLCCDNIYWDGSTPLYTDELLENRLYENTTDLGDSGWDKYYGVGMVDLKYFNVENQQDVLTFKNGDTILDVSTYIEFEDSFTLTIVAPSSRYQIYYTTDGTIPTKSSSLYSSTLTITHSDIYYFIAYQIIGGEITESSILYKVDMFNPNDNVEDFFVNRNGTLTEYTGHFKELEIPSVVNGLRVTALGIRLFDNNEIVSLTLPVNCLTIGEYCFADCTNLKTIEFENVTRLASYAFQNCLSLIEINVDKVESVGEEKQNYDIIGHVFEGCTTLSEVYLPSLVSIGEESFINSGVEMVAIGRQFTTTYGEGVGSGITIYGYSGSTAEEYCSTFGNTFVAIDEFALTKDLTTTKHVWRGDEESISVKAQGLRLSYQWYYTNDTIENGEAIDGENSNTLFLNTLYIGTLKYFVIVTDWEGNTIYSTLCAVTVEANVDFHVAQIYTGTTWNYYESLVDAIEASSDDDVIVLTDDCYLSEKVTIDKNITILSVNSSTIYIHQTLFKSEPIITVDENASLTLGYSGTNYQGLTVTQLNIDGQAEKGNMGIFIKLLQNANLSILDSTTLKNLNADKIIDGENGTTLTIQGGSIIDSKSNFKTGKEYLISATNVVIGDNANLSNLTATVGSIIYINNGNLTINDANFSKNSANFIFFSSNGGNTTINGGTFKNNICDALIKFSIDGTLKLLGGTSQNNTSLNGNYNDVYLTDETITTNDINQDCVQLGQKCGFTNYYLYNSKIDFPIKVMEELTISQINFDILNVENYENSPIIIFEDGLTADISCFRYKWYYFVLGDTVNSETYVYLQEQPDYTLTYIISENESKTQKYKAGETIEIIENPTTEYYDFVGWYKEKECINQYNFTVMPSNDVTVYAKWTPKSYTIYASSDDNGQITPNGKISKLYMESQTFFFTASVGYHVANIYIDGNPLSASLVENAIINGYTFENINKDYEIYVTFEIDLFSILSETGENGTISPLGTRSYRYGQSATYIITANIGYHIENIFIDGQPLDNNEFDNILKNGYVFENITTTHTIRVEFSINIYVITSSSNENGDVTPKGEIKVEHGQSQTFFITASEGYHVESIIVDDNILDSIELNEAITNGYTFKNITQNHTLQVEFKVTTYQITYDLGYGNSDEIVGYEYNSIIKAYVPMREGYDFIGWFVDEDLQEEYDFSTMPAGDFTLYAKWKIEVYKLDTIVVGNGEISLADEYGHALLTDENGEIEREYNSSVVCYITPDKGYYVLSITIDDVVLDGEEFDNAKQNGYKFENIDDVHTIEATFDICKYTLSINVEGDGRFYTNQDITNVKYGESRIFYIDTDYDKNRIEVYVNGRLFSESESSAIRIDNIEQDLNINVRFIERPFFETETGKIVLIVIGIIGGIILIAIPITVFISRKRLYSDMEKY